MTNVKKIIGEIVTLISDAEMDAEKGIQHYNNSYWMGRLAQAKDIKYAIRLLLEKYKSE